MSIATELDFLAVEPGEFEMGSPEDEALRLSNEKKHHVILTQPYAMQSTTITVGLWRSFIEETGYLTDAETGQWAWVFAKLKKWKIPGLVPDYSWEKQPGFNWYNPGFRQAENHPVTNVSWFDVQEFIKWFNLKENRFHRLPTEAEWEYACRAGSTTPFNFGPDVSRRKAQYARRFDSIEYEITRIRTVPVDHFKPNQWGFYNMHGNVWEWCQDACYIKENTDIVLNDTYLDHVENPLGQEGDHRILRGGSWAYTARFCRSAFRRKLPPVYRASGIGFRLVSPL